MILTDYYDILLQGIDSRSTVSKLVHGVSWTAAVLSDGSCGVAMHTTGETVPRMFDTLIGRPLKEAAGAVLSWNMEEASEALAAVNAFYNRPDCAFLQPEAKTLDGVDLAGKRVGMIGHMIGHSNITAELLAPAAKLWIMDREEKPGAYPDSAAEFFLPDCDVVHHRQRRHQQNPAAPSGTQPQGSGHPDRPQCQLLPGADGAGDRPPERARHHPGRAHAAGHRGKAHVGQPLVRDVPAGPPAPAGTGHRNGAMLTCPTNF